MACTFHTDDILDTISKLAVQASAEALRLQREGFESFSKQGLTESAEIYTSADLEAQRLVVEGLARAFPGVPIVAEEDQPETVDGDTFFTVDPVDGTLCFSQQGTNWGCIIGYVEGGRPCAGTLAAPAMGLTATTARGKGCYINKQRLTVSARAPKAILMPIGPWTPPYAARAAAELESQGYRIIPTMSAIGSTLRLLTGEACAYFCGAEKIWDMSASALAVEEAGGFVSTLFGGGVSWDTILVHCLLTTSEDAQSEIAAVLKRQAGK